MKTKFVIFTMILSALLPIKAQEISLIEDLAPGAFNGYYDDATVIEGEIYFISAISFFELYKVNKELKIEKVIGNPDINYIVGLSNSADKIYMEDALSLLSSEIVRYDLNTHHYESILDVGYIEQNQSLKDAVVLVEEDENSKDKRVYYIKNDKDPIVIVENLNLGQYDLEITEIDDFVILSPMSYEDYDGELIIYNKVTGQIDNSLFTDICSLPEYAYGFEEILVYACENIYYALDIESNDVTELGIVNAESLRMFTEGENYSINQDYILLYPQQSDQLISISKDDLEVSVLSTSMTSIVDLFDETGFIYITEEDFQGNETLYKMDETGQKIEIAYMQGSIRLLDGAILNDIPHILIAFDKNTGFTKEAITFIDENNELKTIKEISQGTEKSVFETIGSAIVFNSSESGIGTEFFSLQYPLSNGEIQIQKKDMFYPSVSHNGVLHSSDLLHGEFKLLNAKGQEIETYNEVKNIILPEKGLFYIVGRMEGKTYIQKVMRI